jgi:hypothetical protein
VLACWETKPSAQHHHDLSDFVAFVVRQMDIGEAVLQVAMAYMFRLKHKVGILCFACISSSGVVAAVRLNCPFG